MRTKSLLSLLVLPLLINCGGTYYTSAPLRAAVQASASPTPTPAPAGYVWYSLNKILAISGASNTATAGTTITFDTKIADVNSEFDISTGIFTPKTPGYYQVTAQISVPAPSGGWPPGGFCQLAGIDAKYGLQFDSSTSMSSGATGPCVVQAIAQIPLVAGDNLRFKAIVNPATSTQQGQTGFNYFQAHYTGQ